MNNEVQLIVEVWDLVRDSISPSRRPDVAMQLLRAFEDHGYDPEEMKDLMDEDRYLQRAYVDLYEEYLAEHADLAVADEEE